MSDKKVVDFYLSYNLYPIKIEDENMKVLAYQPANTSWSQDNNLVAGLTQGAVKG